MRGFLLRNGREAGPSLPEITPPITGAVDFLSQEMKVIKCNISVATQQLDKLQNSLGCH